MNTKKTTLTQVSYGRGQLWAGMVVLMTCLSLFSSDAGALYSIFNHDGPYVYGLWGSDVQPAIGSEFGVVSAVSDSWDAYGLYSDDGGVVISGDFGVAGSIIAQAAEEHAYGLYSDTGSITTDALNGTIVASAGYWRAVGLFTENDSIITGDIGGTITASAGGSSAFGLRSDYGGNSITTGDITGVITAVAGGDRAYGFRSYGTIYTGAIDGTITATADGDYAYGMYASGDLTVDGNIGSNAQITARAGEDDAAGLYSANGSININGEINGTISATAQGLVPGSTYGLYADVNLTTGAINGTITAEETLGSVAYALYAGSDLTVDGNIGSTAHITATAEIDNAGGLYSNSGSITVNGAIDGNITATAGGNNAYGLYTGTQDMDYDPNDLRPITTGAINGTITAIAGGEEAKGLATENGSITTGDVNGTITAIAGTEEAYGFHSENGDINITTITINGKISARADVENAKGLYSENGSIYIGAINGTITADVNGEGAFGLYSKTGDGDNGDLIRDGSGSIYIGEINGTISATVAGQGDYDYDEAYGLRSDSLIEIGDVNGTITARTLNGSDAYGLWSSNGDINIDTVTINGNISAEANGDNAYGVYTENGSIYTGAINGTITATAGGNDAAGLYTANGSITTGDVNGVITATAAGTGNASAYGIYASDNLTTGAINGTITAEMTNGSGAYGLYSNSGTIYTGDINGTITAFAETSDAAGLYTSSADSIYTGAINGTITADANTGSNAYGLYSNGHLDVDGIGSDAVITATAGQNNAAGLYSSNGSIHIDGDIDGTITAFAETDNAYGLYNGSGNSIYTGMINGTITADANTGSNAYGLYANGHLDVDGIGENAVISATAGQSYAYGLYSTGSLHIDGDIDGTISAETINRSYAAALYANGDMTVGDIGSTAHISAKAGIDYAYGLYSNGSLTTGDIDGTIEAKACNGDSYAYALYSGSDMTINGDIGSDAMITATADISYAAGLYNSGVGSLTTNGEIHGTIDANAGTDYAYGILSYGPMDVTIDGGTVSAVAHGGTNAAAIQSGRFGGSVDIQPADDDYTDDTVEIVAGSTIIGDVNLGWDGDDDDVLTLSGDDSDSTTFNDNIYNVEHINITGGTWYFNGNVYNSAIALDGGILSGNGTLSFDLNVDNGGVLAPGGSIGSMTIDGDLTIGSGGTYEVDVNNSENHDYVGVTGTAYLGGTLRGNVYGGERIDHSFNVNVLDADTIYGEFANVTGTTLFPIFDVGSGSVILQVIMDYAYYADTDNQHSVGNAFNYIVEHDLDTVDDMNVVLTAIEGLPDGAAANKAYNQIMPQDALGLADIIRNAMNQYSESIFGRMSNIRNSRQYTMAGDSRYLLASAGAAALPPKTDEWMPFAKVFGSWGDRDAESDIAGYNYNIYGLAGGVDKLVSDNTLMGISVAGSRAGVDYSQSGTSSDIDSMFCSVYGSYFMDDWHVGVTLGYGHSWYDSQRGIPFISREAKSDHQGNSYSAAVELGKNLGDKSMILEPVAGIGYSAVQESGYTEKGADALNLKVDSATADGIYSKLGVRAAKEFRSEKNPNMIFVPNVSAFWIHDFADRVELSSSFIGGGSFTTEGFTPMRDTFNVGAGLNVYYNKNVRLFIDYGWQSERSFNSHTVQAGAQWSF